MRYNPGMMASLFVLIVASIGQAAPAPSHITIIRDSAAFRTLRVFCASPEVSSAELDEKSANAVPPARFESVTLRCPDAFVTGLFVIDRGVVTLLSTCQMEPALWTVAPIAVSSGPAVVISGECGGFDDGGDSVPAQERLIAIGRQQSGAWVHSRVPNSMRNYGELPGEEFSDYRIQTSSAGVKLVANYFWDDGNMYSNLNVKSEITFKLTESDVHRPMVRMLSATFTPVAAIDAYSTIESSQLIFQFESKQPLRILECGITPRTWRWKVTNGTQTAWIDQITKDAVWCEQRSLDYR